MAYLEGCIDLAAAVGSPHVAGPMYSATGKARLLPPDQRDQQRAWAAESLRQVADYAGERGVRLALEPLNRFETDLVNTVEQGLDLCHQTGRDNVGLMLDTFHMNIEEKSISAAMALAGDRLFHMQVAENDRGTPGRGHVPWEEVLGALDAAGLQRAHTHRVLPAHGGRNRPGRLAVAPGGALHGHAGPGRLRLRARLPGAKGAWGHDHRAPGLDRQLGLRLRPLRAGPLVLRAGLRFRRRRRL